MAGKPQNVFTKIHSVKEKLLPATQGLNDKQIRSILAHCWYYKAKRRKDITQKEREVNDLLLSHGISSKTAYEWFRMIDAPDHIKQKLSKGEISFAEASSKKYLWNRMVSRRTGKEIMQQIKDVIGGLEWKNKNTTI